NTSSPTTLILTQTARWKALYPGLDLTAFKQKVGLLAASPNVNGMVIDLPSSIYDAWDMDKCSIVKANDVTKNIYDLLHSPAPSGFKTAYDNATYVVLVGDDDILPMRRVPDETIIGYERLYL